VTLARECPISKTGGEFDKVRLSWKLLREIHRRGTQEGTNSLLMGIGSRNV
jgi:hypothetical protein